MSAVKDVWYPCEDEYPTRITALNIVSEVQSIVRAGRCLYCNQAVVGGASLHAYCKGDYEWELKMKTMNRMWHPS